MNRNSEFTDFSYPVIYESQAPISGHAVIISTGELKNLLPQHDVKDILYICVGGKPSDIRVYNSSIIAVEKNVSPSSVANNLNEIFHEFETWDSDLKNVLYENGSFQDLVNCCDPIIIEPIAITDKDFQVIAYSEMSDELGYNSNVDEDNRLSLDAFNSFISQVDYERICTLRESFVISSADGLALCRNIFSNNEFVGRIGIKLCTDEDYIQLFNTAIMDHFYLFAVKLYNKYASFDDREFSKNSLVSILQDGINNKKIPDKLGEKVYKENRWHKNDKLQLFQFMANPRQDKSLYAKYLSSKISRIWSDSICFTYMEHLLLLINISNLSSKVKLSFYETLSMFLTESSLIAGVSRAFEDISYLRSAFEQTETAVLFGVIKDPSYCYYMFDNYILDYMLQNSKGYYEKEELCSSKLLTLIQHDKEKGTEYHKTLLTYFENKYNAAEAAKRLFINRSTFHYRLDRIQELVNIDFESSDERLYIAMSFKILELEKFIEE